MDNSFEARNERKEQRKRIKKIVGIVAISAGVIAIAVLLKKDQKMTVEYLAMVKKNQDLTAISERCLDFSELCLKLGEHCMDMVEKYPNIMESPLVPADLVPSLTD